MWMGRQAQGFGDLARRTHCMILFMLAGPHSDTGSKKTTTRIGGR
jgi:hypothetical protein